MSNPSLRAIASEIETHQFELAHGKAPRGTGSWAFTFFRGRDVILDASGFDAFFAPGLMKFGEAKLWAAAKALELGASRIVAAS